MKAWLAAAYPAARAVLLILLAPVLVRGPAFLLGLSDNPFWFASNLVLPGSEQPLPGLPGFLDFNAGWTTQALGTLAARDWLSGHIPWWDPFSGLGMPLAAEMQSSALFLPYILLLALPMGMTLLAVSLQWTAGLAAWRLLLRMEVGANAAVAGAIMFELCASFAWLGPPMSLPVAFLPLFLLGIERARAAASQRRPTGWRLMAVAVALSLYAGFPETAYLDGLLALIWAVFRFATLPGARLGFAARVAAGGAAGLLLAAPLLWPFLDLLPRSSLGTREAIDMAGVFVPPEGLVQFLMPGALGAPAGLSGLDPSGELIWLWGRSGGYAGMVLALGAILGAAAPGPNRALRWVLTAWCTLLIGRIAGAPWLADAFAVVPFHSQIETFRYASAAWLLPFCLLCAHAVDRPPSRWLVASAAIALAGAGCLALRIAWPLAHAVPTAKLYMAAAALWGAISLAAGAAAFAKGRPRLIIAAALADLAVLFIGPYVAGRRHSRLDQPAVAFLQSHLGLQRFGTLAPFQPNYGAIFGTASVNYNYLPVPSVWSDYVEAHLRPGAIPVLFNGNYPVDEPGKPTNAAILAEHLSDYAAVGVRYVLALPGQNPFAADPPQAEGGPREPFRLEPGATLSGELPASDRPVTGLGVVVGTYGGRADGPLELELCAADACGRGRADLATAPDNQALEIALDRPVPAGAKLAWTLRHPSGRTVAIWRVPTEAGPEPLLTPSYAPAPGQPARVYRDDIMTIYEVPDAAPYFSVEGGPCALAPLGRTEIGARCDAPATLVRRELFMPGWTARVDGRRAPVSRSGEVFQAVALPAGEARVTFGYVPPGAPFYAALFVLGAAGLAPWRITSAAARPAPARPPGPST